MCLCVVRVVGNDKVVNERVMGKGVGFPPARTRLTGQPHPSSTLEQSSTLTVGDSTTARSPVVGRAPLGLSHPPTSSDPLTLTSTEL
jgi:hypothetical protein